jgi:D-alanyl-D-alanine carboxypeptidase (penicillin-binding protein 5/6)
MNFFFPKMLGLIAGASLAVIATGVAAQSYIVVDSQTGHILGSKDMTDKRQIASLTKVATAMVVLDWAAIRKADLGQLVDVPAQAIRVGGVNPAGLEAGDLIALRDLLYAALMASDNVAAYTLAYHIGPRLPNPERLDPVGNFVAHMNALARQLGMKRTLFLNPAGLDNFEGALPYSTAADMARITRYAYTKPAFPFYVSQKTREIHIQRADQQMDVWLQNTNQLLGTDGIDGVKTGRTSKAGDCVILSADRRPEVSREGDTVYTTPRRIIVVVLGSTNREADGSALMRQGWALYDEWAAGGRKTSAKSSL